MQTHEQQLPSASLGKASPPHRRIRPSPVEVYRHAPRATIHGLVAGDGPSFGAMIGLVAIVVATVILVFFGIGYLLGRAFL
jgi:hypothetical protein